MLESGEQVIDLHEEYLECHRQGWQDAIGDFRRGQLRRDDAIGPIAALKCGVQGYHDGYKMAKRQLASISVGGESALPPD